MENNQELSIEKQILKLILLGTNEKPKSNDEIINFIRLNNPKVVISAGTVRNIIHDMRINNIPIIANNRGYYIAETKEELLVYIQRFEQRMASMEAAIYGLKNSSMVNEINFI